MSTKIQALALVAVGSLLGYLAASTDLFRRTTAAPPPTAALVPSTGSAPEACCADNVNKGELLALAGHNERVAAAAQKDGKKPNILVIFGDDIGVHSVSAYSRGMMGFRTPNIDRIGQQGALFTDAYAEQSCTTGRAALILGQHPFRTGLLTIGMPG